MKYEIPKEWLDFCEFKKVSPEYRFYFYGHNRPEVTAMKIAEIEPPVRDAGIVPFKKFKMVPVLMALMDPNGELPPITVMRISSNQRYQYKVTDGFHRFYAAALAGYELIPALVVQL